MLLLALLLAAIPTASAQLSVTQAAFNPFAGQGVPPDGIPASQFPVPLFVGTTNLVSISEVDYTFTANIYLLYYFVDTRTLPIMLSNYTECTYYCSSRMSTFRNLAGEPACCDGVYIPQAYVINGVEFLAQTFPYRYLVVPFPGDLVVYYTQLQATFSASFDYRSYPFDTHYMNIDLMTDFLPVLPTQTLSGAGFSASDGYLIESQLQGSGDAMFQPGAYRPSLTNVDCAGWVLQETWLDVMNWTVHNSDSAQLHHDRESSLSVTVTGFRVYLRISRASRVFYFVILILPTALIVFFSFVIFGFPMTSHKARIQLIVTLFLTLIILQFTLQQFLPGTFTLISPVYLVLLSYIYTFVLMIISVFSAMLLQQCRRRERAFVRKHTSNDFQRFKAALLAIEQQDAAQRSIRNQSSARIQRIIGSQAPHARHTELVDGAGHIIPDTKDDPKAEVPGLDHEEESRVRHLQPQHCSEIDEPLFVWYERQHKRWCFRNLAPYRNFLLWFRFIGQSHSQRYMEYICHRLEVISRRILFLGYLAAAGIIFGVAAMRDDPDALLNNRHTT